jgi:hypothetical protein
MLRQNVYNQYDFFFPLANFSNSFKKGSTFLIKISRSFRSLPRTGNVPRTES